ncbi:MAG: lipopolysaccharide biosynthesis protein [Actinomycetota bacterium]|nr:lipopolysaccharide biosynthesis protein [Actinomycetota bacterium]
MLSDAALAVRLTLKKTRLIGEGAWMAFGQAIAAIGLLAGVRVLTEFVPPNVFGAISLSVGVSTFGMSIFCKPFLHAALRFYPDASQKGRIPALKKIVNGFLFRTTGMLILALAAAGFIFRQRMDPLLVISLIGLLIVDVTRIREMNFLNAARRQRPFALWQASDAWARPLAALAVIFAFGVSAGKVLAGYFAGSLLVLVLFYKSLNRDAQAVNPGAEDGHMASEIRRFAMPLVPLAVISWITSISDRYLIGGMAGLQQVGIYAAVYGLVSQPFLMTQLVIEQTVRPVYFEAVARGEIRRERKAFLSLLLATGLACLLGVILITLLRGEVAGLLLAKKYRSGAGLIPWIALGYAFLAMSYVFEKICYAYKRTRDVLFIEAAGAAVCLCIEIPAIYYYGIYGAALSVPVYFGIQLVISIIMASRVMRQHKRAWA